MNKLSYNGRPPVLRQLANNLTNSVKNIPQLISSYCQPSAKLFIVLMELNYKDTECNESPRQIPAPPRSCCVRCWHIPWANKEQADQNVMGLFEKEYGFKEYVFWQSEMSSSKVKLFIIFFFHRFSSSIYH